MATAPLTIRALGALTRVAADGVTAVVLVAEGGAEVIVVGAAPVRLFAGDLLVVPSGSDITATPRADAQVLCAELPAFVMEPWCSPRGGPAVARGDLARLATDAFVSLHRDPAADAALSDVIGALARLLAAATADPGSDVDADADADADATLRSGILRHVDRAIRRGPVTPGETARRFGISVRKLHQLFATEPRSFMQTVMDRRAHWCALELRTNPDATPAALARKWGFADSSHFQRVWSRLDQPATAGLVHRG